TSCCDALTRQSSPLLLTRCGRSSPRSASLRLPAKRRELIGPATPTAANCFGRGIKKARGLGPAPLRGEAISSLSCDERCPSSSRSSSSRRPSYASLVSSVLLLP